MSSEVVPRDSFHLVRLECDAKYLKHLKAQSTKKIKIRKHLKSSHKKLSNVLSTHFDA